MSEGFVLHLEGMYKFINVPAIVLFMFGLWKQICQETLIYYYGGGWDYIRR